MKIRIFIAFLFTFGIWHNAYSQLEDFRYSHSVEGVKESGWYAIDISYQKFAKLNNDYSGLRLFELFEGKTEEVPYVLDKEGFYPYYEQERRLEEILVRDISIEETKNWKKTVILVELHTEINIWALRIFIKPDRDYYHRHFELYQVCDRKQDEYNWENLEVDITENCLVSGYPDTYCQLVNPSVTTNCLRIEIENGDDKPLKIDSVKVYSPICQLRARFHEGRKYLLAYGNKNIVAPEYDIINFIHQIPEVIDTLEVGEEKEFSKDDLIDEKHNKTGNEELWIWIVMVGVIIILGFFAFKMLKSGK